VDRQLTDEEDKEADEAIARGFPATTGTGYEHDDEEPVYVWADSSHL
jgi:hypothetical protein